MSADGHAFASSAELTELDRLVSTADTSATLKILCTTTLTPGASPSATTTNGFSSSVTKNADGDYTLNFANAFTATPEAWAIPVYTSGALFAVVYSVSTTQIRVRFYNASGTLTDPDSAFVFAMGD